MGCPKYLGEFWFRIPCGSTEVLWEGLTPFFAITGGQTISYAMSIRRATGNAVALPATQTTAAIESAAGAPAAASGSYQNTNGATTLHTTDLTSVTDKFSARGGVFGKLSGGTTFGFVEGTMSVFLFSCGQPVGTRIIEVPAALATSTPSYFLLGRVAGGSADKLRAAIVSTDANDLEYLFYVRGVNEPDAPGSWTALNAGTWTAIADGNSATCHADASVSGITPANFHRMDVMIALRMASGGSGPKGVVRVAAAMSYT